MIFFARSSLCLFTLDLHRFSHLLPDFYVNEISTKCRRISKRVIVKSCLSDRDLMCH